jgi:glutathione-independent formaldehyde dehydrogenase
MLRARRRIIVHRLTIDTSRGQCTNARGARSSLGTQGNPGAETHTFLYCAARSQTGIVDASGDTGVTSTPGFCVTARIHFEGSLFMAGNRCLTYLAPGRVEVQDWDYPKLETLAGRRLDHGAILKVLASGICGGDLNLVRGRKSPALAAPYRLGHEVTGEVLEVGRDVEVIKPGDIVSVPFVIACGRCNKCKEGYTHHCELLGPGHAAPDYGYSLLGGQAEYIAVPYADFNLLRYPHRDEALERLLDFALLADLFPTGYHGALSAGVVTGARALVAGAGPVGLACATACFLLGAAVVFVADFNRDRLAQAASFGCVPIDLGEQPDIRAAVHATTRTTSDVDAAIDCVGFAARGHGSSDDGDGGDSLLNTLIEVVRPAGRVALLGEYVTEDLGAPTAAARRGRLPLDVGVSWARSHVVVTGRCPVMRYNGRLMRLLQHERVPFARHVNATPIPLERGPQAYREMEAGAAVKFVLDPHGAIARGRAAMAASTAKAVGS